MFTYNGTGTRISYVWPEETTTEDNLEDLILGWRSAGQRSLDIRDMLRVEIPYFTETGILEARSRPDRIFPWPVAGSFGQGIRVSNFPYIVIIGHCASPFYSLEIPGLCSLLDSTVLTISPIVSPETITALYNAVFNCESSRLEVGNCPPHFIPYLNIARTISVLSKKPKVPKVIDFGPIFAGLFGEKIAAVIMKEIK